MTEKQYFVTHTGDGCICDSISRELEDGVYEELTYHDIVDRLNKLSEENKKLKEILNLIAEAHSYREENTVKEIIRNLLFALDTVTHESANAYHDYTLLNNFFKEHYKEHWDNDKFD